MPCMFRGSKGFGREQKLLRKEKYSFANDLYGQIGNLKEMVSEHNFTFSVLADEELKALKAFDVFYHGDDAPYEDHGAHGEPAYFLVDENGKLLYQQRQTSPFGRPNSTELRKIVQYIGKNLKSN